MTRLLPFACLALLAACGQKGPLYLPESAAPASATAPAGIVAPAVDAPANALPADRTIEDNKKEAGAAASPAAQP
ncbi:MAG: lipoprotein [Moraxellaceae bacterium]|nr:lipoprotein [Moraxellaceae bacterium]